MRILRKYLSDITISSTKAFYYGFSIMHLNSRGLSMIIMITLDINYQKIRGESGVATFDSRYENIDKINQ